MPTGHPLTPAERAERVADQLERDLNQLLKLAVAVRAERDQLAAKLAAAGAAIANR